MKALMPIVDPRIKHVGSSHLRQLSSEKLRTMEGLTVVSDTGLNPLVVIVPYETYLALQEAAHSKRENASGIPE